VAIEILTLHVAAHLFGYVLRKEALGLVRNSLLDNTVWTCVFTIYISATTTVLR
jgi:hypothetical protein